MHQQLTPNNKNIQPLQLPSEAVSTLINGPLKAVIPNGFTLTEGASLTAAQAEECAQALERWIPPKDFYLAGSEYMGLVIHMDFFRRCGGCTVTNSEATDGDL